MKVLIADKLPPKTALALQELGVEVDLAPGLSAEDLPGAIGHANVLVVRSTKVSRATIEAGKGLSLIVRAGAGVNTIDLEAASERGVYVANCPGRNAIAVAELAMGLMISVDRRIPDNVLDLREGRWNKRLYSKADGLYGRTLGVLGLGTIGRELVSRAKAFGMRCICWSRSLTDELAAELGVERASSPQDVAAVADFVSVHTAYSPDTHHIVDEAFLARMQPGSVLINTARGGVVDDKALGAAAETGHLRAALDVYEDEPAASDTQYTGSLAKLDRVYGTHHIGASTAQAQQAVADEVLHIVRSFLQAGDVPNCVNLCESPPAAWQLTVRHLDRVGVLAGVLDALKEEGINVQELKNTIFDGAKAASATIQLEAQPSAELLAGLRSQQEKIIQVTLTALG